MRWLVWGAALGSCLVVLGCGSPAPPTTVACTMVDRFVDADHDGFGDRPMHLCVETASGGLAMVDGDCDDASAAVFPGASEACNRIDDDCDGRTDEDAGALWVADADGDGFGATSAGTMRACSQPSGYSAWSDDCDDTTPDRSPAAREACNGIDDDCNGRVDDDASFACTGTAAIACTTLCGTTGSGTCTACARPAPENCTPPAERCDRMDQDCDGRIDEGAGHVRTMITHAALAGALQVETFPNGSGWIVVAMLPDRSIVAQGVQPDGTLDPISYAIHGTDPTLAVGSHFAAAADATSLYVVWLGPDVTSGFGTTFFGVSAPIGTLVFGARHTLDWTIDGVTQFDLAIAAMRSGGGEAIVVAAARSGGGICLGAATSAFDRLGTDCVIMTSTTASTPALTRSGNGDVYFAWTEGPTSWVTEVAVQGFISYTSVDETSTTRFSVTGARPILTDLFVTDDLGFTDDFALLGWTDASSAEVEALHYTVSSGHGAFSAHTGMTPTTTAACGLALGATAHDGVVVTEPGTVGATTLSVAHLGPYLGLGAADVVDASVQNNGCSNVAASTDGTLLITVTRPSAPVSFVWGC